MKEKHQYRIIHGIGMNDIPIIEKNLQALDVKYNVYRGGIAGDLFEIPESELEKLPARKMFPYIKYLPVNDGDGYNLIKFLSDKKPIKMIMERDLAPTVKKNKSRCNR